MMKVMMKRYIRRVQTSLKSAKRLLTRHPLPKRYIHKNVPYFSQWESPSLVKDIISGSVKAEDDPHWKTSGAKTKEEYSVWSALGCGMACTKMLIAHLKGKEIPLVDLAKRSLAYGTYTLPLEESQGLIYNPYAKYLKDEFNLNAKVVLPLLPREIMEELSHGRYVIASVSPQIRYTDSHPKNKGGHLVLMLGYDLEKQELYLHNPSGFTQETQKYATISFADFKKFFGGRGIVIK